MKKTLIFACIVGLLFVSHSYADDAYTKPFSGGVFLGGRALSLDHQSGKFNEYNGISPGLFGGADVHFDTDAYHFDAEGAYLGNDDAYLKLKGGRWGAFKYNLYYNEFPHNLSFKDRTIYVNPGAENLTLPGSPTAIPRNSAAWPSTSFDYKVKRKDIGGTFDFTAISPFFFTIDANQLKREGQMPWGAPSPFIGFGRTVEFPLAVDNTTTNTNALVGWKSKQFYLAFGGGFSKFTNNAEHITRTDPFVGSAASIATGTVVTWPDNRSWNLGFTGTANKLPFNSTFAVSAGFQRNTSQTRLLTSTEGNVETDIAPTVARLALTRPNFSGDVEYWNVSAGLTSNPIKNLTTKVYYRYLDKKNRSNVIGFTNTSTGEFASSETFDYQRTTFGAEASYRFLKNLKGILGYEFTDLRRRAQEAEALEDIDSPHGADVTITNTWDHRVTAQLVYNPLDWLSARAKYQKLYRGANFNLQSPANPTNTAADAPDQNNVLENNIRRFDAANKQQDMFKFTFELTPFQSLDVALEYAYKYDNYLKNELGYREGSQNEFIIDASYQWKNIRFFAFFDYDTSYTKQRTRQVTPNPGSNADPNSSVVNANSFNWEARLNNNNYAYGVGASVPLIKNRLHFIVQYDFEKNNGTADFTSQFLATGLNQNNIDIMPWDDYTRQAISAKLKYDVTRDFGLVFGYLYSQFKWNDAQFNGYQYIMPVGASFATTNTYLTGAYTDQSYTANLYYLKAIYRF